MNQIVENFKKAFQNEDLFIRSTPAQMEKLERLMGGEVGRIIDFYREFQPYNVPMSKSYVKLLDIDNMLLENTNAEPGKYLAEYGCFVFALTVGGNVLCIDTNNVKSGDASVLIADANFCSYNEIYECTEIGIIPDEVLEQLADNEIVPLNYPNIVKCLKKVEDSFFAFMLKLSNDEYEDIEKFLEE